MHKLLYSLGFVIVCAGLSLAAEPPKSAPVVSTPHLKSGLTQAALERREPKDPEWEAYVHQRARIRVLAVERSQAVAAAAPAIRSKVSQEWEKKNRAELDLFEQTSAIIAKRSAPATRLEAQIRKASPGKLGTAAAPKHLNVPVVDATGRVKGEVKDGTTIPLSAPKP